MTLNSLKSEIAVHKNYSNLDQKGWEAKIEHRDITKRSQKDFDYLKKLYPAKIESIRRQLRETGYDIKVVPQTKDGKMKSTQEIVDDMNEQLEHINHLVAKEERLLDKLAVVLKEEDLRNTGKVTRTGIHDAADYYIDYVNGNDSNDGLSTGNAWKTITKYTSVTSRLPGDRAFLRANTTWTQGTEAEDIGFDEDGTADNPISIIGCDSVTNDPWSDSSDVKPVVDFENAAYQFSLAADNYWRLERFAIKRSADTNGQLRTSSYIKGFYIKDCDISDGASSSVAGLNLGDVEATIDGCTFENCYGHSIRTSNSILNIKNCIIDAGSGVGSSRGIYSSGLVFMKDCSIAPSNAFSEYDISVFGSTVYLRNCVFGVSENIYIFHAGRVFIEDSDGVYGAHKTKSYQGVITKETSSPRSGGAGSYAKLLSDNVCGVLEPLILGDSFNGFSQLWLAKDVEYTITVYARTGSAWDSALSASQAFLRCSYLSNASTAARTEIDSTETITNDANWTAFTVTFTPLQTGFAYLQFYLAAYEDVSEYIDVDILPVVT